MTVAKQTRQRRVGSMEILVAGLLVLAVLGGTVRGFVVGNPDVATAATVFCGVFVQALPFLALGVVISGLIAAYVSPDRLARWLPRRTGVAILTAGVGGAALPGCECGAVPVARRLFGDADGSAGSRQGAAALTFMLAAPAINPVVLVSTAVAFPGEPAMIGARFTASLLTAVIMGAVWSRWGRAEWITRKLPRAHHDDGSKWTVFTEAARHDFLQAASYLVLGAATAAALHVLVPPAVYEHLAGQMLLGILTMALLAFVLALCSEADAFVAASLTMLPLLPRLVFLVVGPAVDVKLFAMQAGMFGRAFATRFAPTTFVVATVVATVVGLAFLGGAR
ncbi:permease [Mycobacterium antarcticum]|nr:permease [Mycolicibacterium sp. TUM20985]GLP83086.1 permease [Mycolicibacterium sp. TUM20984]